MQQRRFKMDAGEGMEGRRCQREEGLCFVNMEFPLRLGNSFSKESLRVDSWESPRARTKGSVRDPSD